jgi:hypothetical protein
MNDNLCSHFVLEDTKLEYKIIRTSAPTEPPIFRRLLRSLYKLICLISYKQDTTTWLLDLT